MKGCFITFEGGEGSGKSTQIKMLAEALRASGREVVVTREPGGGSTEIRELLVTGEPGRWDRISETLLFFADRRKHLSNKVWPAMEKGQIVRCDRFADSTMAYQGYGYGNNPEQQELIRNLYRTVAGDVKPDVTFLLDIPVEIGLKRSCREDNKEQRFEQQKLQFHENLRQAYLKMAKAEPNRFVVVDATQPIMAIHMQIMNTLMQRKIFRQKGVQILCLSRNNSK